MRAAARPHRVAPPPRAARARARSLPKLYVPGDAMGGESAEAKAAKTLRRLFTFVAIRVVQSHLEGAGNDGGFAPQVTGRDGACMCPDYDDLRRAMERVPLGDGDAWLDEFFGTNPEVALRICVCRETYMEEFDYARAKVVGGGYDTQRERAVDETTRDEELWFRGFGRRARDVVKYLRRRVFRASRVRDVSIERGENFAERRSTLGIAVPARADELGREFGDVWRQRRSRRRLRVAEDCRSDSHRLNPFPGLLTGERFAKNHRKRVHVHFFIRATVVEEFGRHVVDRSRRPASSATNSCAPRAIRQSLRATREACLARSKYSEALDLDG